MNQAVSNLADREEPGRAIQAMKFCEQKGAGARKLY